MTPDFLKNVFLLCAVSSVTFGVVGSFVVARRIGYLTGAISHSAFGGIGFGLWLKQHIALGTFGLTYLFSHLFKSSDTSSNLKTCEFISRFINPVPAALIFSVLAAILVDWIRKHAREREETILGAIWALGMALGLLFLEGVKGYVSATTYLFGDVLLVSNVDVWTATTLGTIILTIVACDFKKIEAVCFDEEYAELRGVNVSFQNRLLLVVTAISVVLMLRVVGMAMIVALLTLPAATASRFTKRLSSSIIMSTVICFAGSWIGVWLSYLLNSSTGPTIILVIATFYAISLPFGKR